MKTEIKNKFRKNLNHILTGFLTSFIFLILLIEMVSASDVAYIYNRKGNINNNVKNVFS